MDNIYTYLIVVLLLKQSCISALTYCPEAVASVEVVTFCPTSKNELDIAAKRKNCDKLAISQNCSSIEDFVYHCTINSYRNATLEVCAPKRTILGHCTEFNIVGGVIQDQQSAPCNKTFPKCAEYYASYDAYKYDDCYKLVESARVLRKKTTTQITGIQTETRYTVIICFVVFLVAVVVATFGAIIYVVMRKTEMNPKRFFRPLSNSRRKTPEDCQLRPIGNSIKVGSSSSATSSRSTRTVYYDASDKQPMVPKTNRYDPSKTV